MIGSFLYFVLGFLSASFLSVLCVQSLLKRTIRLTTENISNNMPRTMPEIAADRDLLQAEFAVKLRQLELTNNALEGRIRRQRIELNKKEIGRAFNNEI